MGFRLSAGECCLSSRLFFLDVGHFSRWVLAALCTVVSVLKALTSHPSADGRPAHTEGLGSAGKAHSRLTAGHKSCGQILSWMGRGSCGAGWRVSAEWAGGRRAMGSRGTGQLGGLRERESSALKPQPAGHRLRVTLRSDGPPSSPALRTPLLVGWHHLVPPDDSRLPPRRLRFNQVSESPDSESESPGRKSQTSLAASCWSGLRLGPASSVSQNSELPSQPCDSVDPSVPALRSSAARGRCGFVPQGPDPAEPGLGNWLIGRGGKTEAGSQGPSGHKLGLSGHRTMLRRGAKMDSCHQRKVFSFF